jgi:hypothetical protein
VTAPASRPAARTPEGGYIGAPIPRREDARLLTGHAHLYYRFNRGTRLGDKYLCVVVKFPDQDAFVLTAYLTDKIKRGIPIWPETE